jgi:hypothetical protein
VVLPAYTAIDTVGVGPIRLRGNRIEALFGDEPPGDRGPRGIELVRAVRAFPDQHEMRIAADLVEHVGGWDTEGCLDQSVLQYRDRIPRRRAGTDGRGGEQPPDLVVQGDQL